MDSLCFFFCFVLSSAYPQFVNYQVRISENIRKGINLEESKSIIEKHPEILINYSNILSNPLYVSIYYKRKDFTDFLLSKGANVYCCGDKMIKTIIEYDYELFLKLNLDSLHIETGELLLSVSKKLVENKLQPDTSTNSVNLLKGYNLLISRCTDLEKKTVIEAIKIGDTSIVGTAIKQGLLINDFIDINTLLKDTRPYYRDFYTYWKVEQIKQQDQMIEYLLKQNIRPNENSIPIIIKQFQFFKHRLAYVTQQV